MLTSGEEKGNNGAVKILKLKLLSWVSRYDERRKHFPLTQKADYTGSQLLSSLKFSFPQVLSLAPKLPSKFSSDRVRAEAASHHHHAPLSV